MTAEMVLGRVALCVCELVRLHFVQVGVAARR